MPAATTAAAIAEAAVAVTSPPCRRNSSAAEDEQRDRGERAQHVDDQRARPAGALAARGRRRGLAPGEAEPDEQQRARREHLERQQQPARGEREQPGGRSTPSPAICCTGRAAAGPASPGGGAGIRIAAITYAATPMPPNGAATAKPSRTSTESTPSASPIPPQTPTSMRSEPERRSRSSMPTAWRPASATDADHVRVALAHVGVDADDRARGLRARARPRCLAAGACSGSLAASAR